MLATEKLPMDSLVSRDAAAIARPGAEPPSGRINLGQGDVRNGLARLVLALVQLLHELLQRQAIRRLEAGALTEAQAERLGTALMNQAQQIESLCREFGFEKEDLNIDLGPLGKLW